MAPTDVDKLVAGAREALAEFEALGQADIDRIVTRAALAALSRHVELAQLTVEETGRGVVEDKAVKNHFACEHVVHDMAGLKTVGVISRDEVRGITEIADPAGVICAVTPATNPRGQRATRRSPLELRPTVCNGSTNQAARPPPRTPREIPPWASAPATSRRTSSAQPT
ncbi:hypothetical protein [Streptomyces acidiscabies]|uniref:hypothetical protein n=1 Tax=Streptomyces acidiscabies TaxID=42234 RepID=UPI00076E6B1B|nr:aldehyde-alcohol dehydrogenase [Streptomyces acidiscabies]